MIQNALQYIISLSGARKQTIEDREYTDKALIPVKAPTQAALQVLTLTAIADYFTDNPDNACLGSAIVHIDSHLKITVVSPVLPPWQQRHDYLTATTAPVKFPFGRYMPIEEFMIALQTHFVQDDTIAKLMQMAGNLTDSTSITLLDDGVTQQAEAKTGIARVSNVVLPNPVTLAPYRTFLEVAQPTSPFVFRLKKSDQGPTAALFEADGGNWQLEAVKRIRDWMRTHLPEGTTILA